MRGCFLGGAYCSGRSFDLAEICLFRGLVTPRTHPTFESDFKARIGIFDAFRTPFKINDLRRCERIWPYLSRRGFSKFARSRAPNRPDPGPPALTSHDAGACRSRCELSAGYRAPFVVQPLSGLPGSPCSNPSPLSRSAPSPSSVRQSRPSDQLWSERCGAAVAPLRVNQRSETWRFLRLPIRGWFAW